MLSFCVIASIFFSSMKEDTFLANVSFTSSLVHVFRRMPVETCLLSLSHFALCVELNQGGLSVVPEGLVPVCLPSPSLDLRLSRVMDFFVS